MQYDHNTTWPLFEKLTVKIASDSPHPRAELLQQMPTLGQEKLSNVRKMPLAMKGLVIDRAIIYYKIERSLCVLNQSEEKPKLS